jgi:ABC-type transport system involved in Fe-S cluster assembly fused permease/ATPase subunit
MLMFEFLPVLVNTLIGIVVIFMQDIRIGLVFVVWVLIHTVTQLLLYQWKFKYDIVANEEDSKLSGHISDVVSNQLTVNSF